MRYKNMKTKAVIDVHCKINGGDWVKLDDLQLEEPKRVEETPVETEKVVEPKAADDNLDGVTKNQIMQELDAMGVKYDPKAKKADLYALMTKG